MRRMRDLEAALGKLKRLGVNPAKDFGAGNSPQAYPGRLPLDILKIDRSVIKCIGKNCGESAIERTIISMANSLRLGLTGEQAAQLREWDCEFGQGYPVRGRFALKMRSACCAAPADGRLGRLRRERRGQAAPKEIDAPGARGAGRGGRANCALNRR